MNDLSPAALAWLADHHGVISADELRRADVGRNTTQRLVRRGVLRAEHKGVYVLAASRRTIEQRCAVLTAAHPGGFVTGPTGGMLVSLRRMPQHAPLHYAVRHGIHLDPEPGVHLRQTTALRADHRLLRPDGIAVARPPRLAFDLAADLTVLDLVSVLHQLITERRATWSEFAEIAACLCHPARDGSKRFVEALDRLGSGSSRAAHSHPEVELAEALRALRVPVELQVPVTLSDGRVVHLDLGVPDVRWAVELDLHPEHRSLEGHAGTSQRTREAQRAGWQVEPVAELETADVPRLAGELAAAYQLRQRRLAGPSVS